jgi:hypothetical protein
LGSDHEISHYYKSLKLKTGPKSTLEAHFDLEKGALRIGDDEGGYRMSPFPSAVHHVVPRSVRKRNKGGARFGHGVTLAEDGEKVSFCSYLLL